MHARPPPRNVILHQIYFVRLGLRQTLVRRGHELARNERTHRLEYTPGILASVTLSGRGDSQRSGFHSSASSPQICLFWFDERRPTIGSILGDWNLADHLAVESSHWLREREHGVLAGPAGTHERRIAWAS